MTILLAPGQAQLKALRDYLGSRYSETTIRSSVGQSTSFLAAIGVKPTYTKMDVLHYIDIMIRKGTKKSSIQEVMRCLKRFFRANNIVWPIDRTDSHLGMNDGEPEAPVLSDDVIRAMILGVKARPKYPDIQMLALSTLYGLRNAEIAGILNDGCDGKQLKTQTLKMGKIRSHAIPPEFAEVMKFRAKHHAPGSAHAGFDRMIKQYARPAGPHEGFHAIRRALITHLIENGINDHNLTVFIGWKMPQGLQSSKIAHRYFHPDPVAVDKEIFAVHPFYKMWLE